MSNGIILPELSGYANLRVFCIFIQEVFTALGDFYIRSAVCPINKLWKVTYSSFGHNNGVVSNCLYELETSADVRIGIIAMYPSLTKAETKNVFATLWVAQNQKLAVRFTVTTTSPTCWFYASVEEYDYGRSL